VLEELHRMLVEVNTYPRHFQHMHDVVLAREEEARARGDPPPVVAMRFAGGVEKNPKVYSTPSAAEVSVVVVGDGLPPEHYISVYSRHNEGDVGDTHRLTFLSEHVDPLTYPLVHVHGELGHSAALTASCETTSRKTWECRISRGAFACHRLSTRRAKDDRVVEMPHGGGRLFLQWLVDAYARVEWERLKWVLGNQHKLRVETLLGLMDHFSGADGAGPGAVLGVPVLLPSTFGGSPRHVHQCFLDAMALVMKFGRPDFFITMTAAPTWPEVVANLRPGETPATRPDLVARAFHRRLCALLDLVTVQGVLGKCRAFSWAVEFQKRGLPHVHLLVIVEQADKPRTVEQVDSAVSADVPDRERDPELYDLVNSLMTHGPCGALDPTCSCMVGEGAQKHCGKFFPKDRRDSTCLNDNGYPAYKRPCHDPERTVAGGVLTNQHVVPYNSVLLKRLRCHLNVEVCTSIRSVKYLYKYVLKGPDRACIEQVRDEVSEFVEGRYVGSPEAAWRLFEFPIHGKSHVVERLPVHDDLSKPVHFEEKKEWEAFQKAIREDDKLEAWFKWNAKAAELPDVQERARRLSWRYVDMPDHCTWEQKTRTWQLRDRAARRGEVVTRLFAVRPNQHNMEPYYLRLLLLHVPGEHALQWSDLKRVFPGDTALSFRGLASELGLLHDDVETQTMLEEATRQHTSTDVLCALFADALVWLEVQDPRKLWSRFLDAMAVHHRAHTACDLWRRVQTALEVHGKDFKDHYQVASPPVSAVDSVPRERPDAVAAERWGTRPVSARRYSCVTPSR